MHDHNHAHYAHSRDIPVDYGRAFAIGIAANLTYVAVQVVYGLLAHSVALLADAAHNFGDVGDPGRASGRSVPDKTLPRLARPV